MAFEEELAKRHVHARKSMRDTLVRQQQGVRERASAIRQQQ